MCYPDTSQQNKGDNMTTREKLSGSDLIKKITAVFVEAMKNDPENWTKPW